MIHIRKVDYVLLGIVIALTGFEVVFRASIFVRFGILCSIAVFFLFDKRVFNIRFFLVLIPFVLPLVFQSVKFNLYELGVKNIIGLVISLSISYLVLEIVKEKFHHIFIRIVYFLALFSFVFYPTQFFPSIEDGIINTIGSIITPLGTEEIPENVKSKTLIFFTYIYGQISPNAFPRNCGAFWEPGMFAIFLNLALLMNTYLNNKPLLSKRNLVFILALLTTLSTTGYITLFLIVLSRITFVKDIIRFVISIPLTVAIVYFGLYFARNLDFIGEKITSNYESRYSQSSRFGAAIYHFNELKYFPYGGVALKVGEEGRADFYEDRQISPNGITYIFFFYGIIVGVLYYILFYFGLKKWLEFNNVYSSLLPIFFFIVFIMQAFSQDITIRHLYTMILLFPICFSRQQIEGQ